MSSNYFFKEGLEALAGRILKVTKQIVAADSARHFFASMFEEVKIESHFNKI